MSFLFFFFNDTATTEIYTLSLHDALPIFGKLRRRRAQQRREAVLEIGPGLVHAALLGVFFTRFKATKDRKSTRLNSSHLVISYAVFCLKKKKKARASNLVGTHSILRHLRT